MPFPVRTQGYSRKSRVRSSPPSVLSSTALLSRLTLVSSASGGSGSTITQQSFDRALRSSTSSQGRDRRRKSSRRRKRMAQAEMTREQSSDPIDVFAFLEAESVASNSQEQSNTGDPVSRTATLFYDSDHESYNKSWHSDSGISMGGSPTENVDFDSPCRPRLPSLAEERSDGVVQPTARDVYLEQRSPPWVPTPSFPPAWAPPVSLGSSNQPSYKHGQDQQRGSVEQQQSPRGPNSDISGYDLLASKLSSSSASENLVPFYRRFDKLSHRILLQLQDEIVEMEAHLACLDKEDDELRHSIGSVPASRRMDWTWQHSPVHARRLELLAKIHHKMQQYGRLPYSALTTSLMIYRGCYFAPSKDPLSHGHCRS